MKKNIIFYPILPEPGSPGAERSDDVRSWINNFLIPAGRFTLDETEANAYFVSSGDGGLMRAVRDKHMQRKIFFGANRGTRGFMLNPVSDINQIPASFAQLDLVSVYLMQAEFQAKSGAVFTHLAFNDIGIGREIADYIKFNIEGELSHFPNRKVEGTGLILSTPQGTTGCIIKNRGPLLDLDSRRWHISGILTGPYPDDTVTPQKITIKIESRTPVNGYVDGHAHKVEDIESVIVTPTSHEVVLGFIKGLEFEDRRRELKQQVERGEV